MKKSISLILMLSLLLSSCNLTPGNIKQPGDNSQTTIQQDKQTNSQSGQDKISPQNKDTVNKDSSKPEVNSGDSKAPAGKDISNDASVEVLIATGEDFLNSAFEGDVDGMIGFSNTDLADKIETNAKQYVGTKPNYKIEKVDTVIKVLGMGKYLLQTLVSTTKKSDKKKYDFKYSITVEKSKGDYLIADFKRENN